jgi:hypothetical protein
MNNEESKLSHWVMTHGRLKPVPTEAEVLRAALTLQNGEREEFTTCGQTGQPKPTYPPGTTKLERRILDYYFEDGRRQSS